MREKMGIDEKGRMVYYLREDPNPDLFSYDDEIRQKYLDNPKEAEADKDFRPWEASFIRLGYALPEYRPSTYLAHSFEEAFGGMPFGPREDPILEVTLAVVSLTSFIDDRRLFTCSGIVIESIDGSATILTSACLVAIPNDVGTLRVAENVKILVRFKDGPAETACLLGCCLHYNIAFVTVEKEHPKVLPLQGKRIESAPEVVLALGRHYLSRKIMAVTGETVMKTNSFDCVELMFSSCKITKCGIGGPLVNSRGDLVGVNFYDNDNTPYLPSSLVLRCWEHIHTYGSVHHLHFGWKIRHFRQIEIDMREKISKRCKLHMIDDGLLVEEVARSSPADKCGIRDGDIVLEVFGEPVVTLPVPEYAAVFLDKSKFLSEKESVQVQVKIVRKGKYKTLKIDATELNSTHFNRWPLPQPEWIPDSMDGIATWSWL